MNLSPSATRRPLLCYLLLALVCQAAPLPAAVTVQTADGRMLSGEVDAQTDDRLLWIRQQKEQIVMTTAVPWATIAAAVDEQGAIPLNDLAARLRSQTTEEPSGFLLQQVTYQAPSDCEGDCLPAQTLRRTTVVRTPQIGSLDVHAFLVNLDHDVEPDGLELLIAALDRQGRPVPVKGNLYVRLWGERIQPDSALIGFEQLQVWSQPVMPVDFVDGTAAYPLRFRTVHPAFDLGLRPEALVNVRLGVFGQGNFDATAPVEIRRFESFRDRLQNEQGSRYLPHERTGAVRHLRQRRAVTRRQFRNR